MLILLRDVDVGLIRYKGDNPHMSRWMELNRYNKCTGEKQ